MSVKDLQPKIQNGGATPEGVLTAPEYNILLGAVQAHEAMIDSGVISRYNLIRNSGFEGDYTTAELNGNTPLNSDSEMFSPRLKYWNTLGEVKVIPESESKSGYAVELVGSSSITQELDALLIKGEHYILSFKGKGAQVYCGCGNDTTRIDLGDTYAEYRFSFAAKKNHNAVGFLGDATICELQLERGDIRTAWGRSFLDNSKEQAAVEAVRYLANAIKEGNADILGGLLLSNMILLGNYADGAMQKVTAGLNGIYANGESVALWGGGTYEQAIRTVARLMAGHKEWTDDMANFVITHAGDIFLRAKIGIDEVLYINGGANTAFTTPDGKTVTVKNGLIVNIE